MIFILTSCQTFSSKDIKKENEISKQVKIFSTLVTHKIYALQQEENKVLVMDFTDLKKRFTYLGTYISDKLTEELSEIENIKLINRNDIELIMTEISFQQTGLVSDEDMLKIGRFSGANILITGTITDLGDEIDISADIINIATSEMESTSFRIMKTSKIMALISAIINVEEKKERELKEEIERLESEIEQRKQELRNLLVKGAQDIQKKLKAEEEQKRNELDAMYVAKKRQIEEAFRQEEEQKERELKYIDQQIREKSQILAVLREKQKELKSYEDMIESIRDQIVRRNRIVENYIYNGMTEDEAAQALGLRDIYINVESVYGTWKYYSEHGDYRILWSDNIHGVVIGFVNTITGEEWYRLAE